MIEGNLITIKPGIYYFRNQTNNKYYIGQAINLRRRFKSHLDNFKNSRYDNLLYKAFSEYGIDKFDYELLEIIEEELPDKELKELLDKLEKEYITKYNSYNNGYNQTIGGDYGVLGYKMTEEQKQKISNNSKIRASDGRYTIYVYDIQEEVTLTFINSTEASKVLGGKPNSINSAIRRQLYLKRYIIARSIEELENKKNQEYHLNSGKFQNKYTLEEYKKLKEQYKDCTVQELADIMGVSKKTIYNYNKKL